MIPRPIFCRSRAAGLVGVTSCLVALSGACGKGESVSERERALVISEIMYHPVGELGAIDEHEFIEVENVSEAALDLGGYRLSGGIRFVFAPGTMLAPGRQLVVAKRRERLLEVERYQLSPETVVGDYLGALGNDGETIRLERTNTTSGASSLATVVDEVSYGDAFPWPLAADALGAGEAWLSPESLPLSDHRFMGRSLERRDPQASGTTPANWTVSPLDQATPGRSIAGRAGRAGLPLAPTVMAIEIDETGKVGAMKGGVATGVIPPGRSITVRVRIEPDTAVDPTLEFYENEQSRDSRSSRVALRPAAGGVREAQLPAIKAGTVVHYRIVSRGPTANLSSDLQPLSPRPEDPRRFYPLFVGEKLAGETPTYQLFISKSDWERLFDNIVDGRVPENVSGGNPLQCAINPRWDERVPAVLVMGGQVYDIQARYQGSRTNRTTGPRAFDPTKWPASPDFPSTPRDPLSWHFNFPRYARPDGKRSFNLNKLADSACQGFFTRAGNALFEAVGVPAAQSQWARLYINGRYYHYMLRLEHLDEEFLQRAFGGDHEVGDLFKANGTRWDEGPWGFGDGSLMKPYCGYSVDERYAATYERQTLEDERPGSGEVRALLEAMHAARAAGVPALRAFFAETFDLERLTDYLVVRNWLGAVDDIWQNHYLYRRADGRWMLMPTDLDGHFGFGSPSAPDASFFGGIENGRSNFRDLHNQLKDSFFRAYRSEFIERVRALSKTVLHPSNVQAVIDDMAVGYQLDEAKAAPAGITTAAGCGSGDPVMVLARMKAFARARYERIEDGLFD